MLCVVLGFDLKKKKHEGGKPSIDGDYDDDSNPFRNTYYVPEAFTYIKSCILTTALWSWYNYYPHFTQRPGGDPGRHRVEDCIQALRLQGNVHQAEQGSSCNCERTWLRAQVQEVDGLSLWGWEGVHVLFPLPVQNYRRLNLTTALLPDSNRTSQ